MYLSGKRLVIIGRESALINYGKALKDDIAFSENCSSAVFYDVSDPQEPEKSAECAQSGSLSETRLIDGKLSRNLQNPTILVHYIKLLY